MDMLNMGNEVSDKSQGSTLTAGKSLKKKKSLPRLFILGRKKSFKSKPQSPFQAVMGADPLPTPRTPPESSALATGIGWSGRVYEQVPRSVDDNSRRTPDLSPGNITGAREIRSGGSLLNSGGYDSDPIDLGEHETIESYTQKTSHQPEPSWPLQPSFDFRERYRNRLEHATFSTPSTDLSRSQSRQHRPLQSAGVLPPKPYTSIQPHFPTHSTDNSTHTPIRVGSARKADEEIVMRQRSPTTEHWVRWKASYTREDMQGSIRSGLSSVSSALDTGSTEQSSIFTKLSSISGTSIDLNEFQLPKHGSMTVDDAIDLYSAGFEDDFGLSTDETMKSPNEEEVQKRSSQIADAINDSIDSVLLRPPKLNSPETRDSTDIISGEVFRSIFPRPPSIRSPDATHDQYGFQKASRDISIAQYDTWHGEYASVQARRAAKWATFMQDQGLPTKDPNKFPECSAKTQRFIRKGIPPAWRGAAWFHYAGGDAYLLKHPELYSELVLKSQTPKLSISDRESIERDLHRTFPDNIHFKPVSPSSPTTETPLLSSLRRVLSASAIHNPRIGYCQSLNFLAGLLLLFLPEEKAFWMLHIITTTLLPSTHELSLEGANVDLWVLMLALKEALPSIWAKVGGDVSTSATRLPPISLCTTSWFMSLFIGTLPVESVLRVWDVLFYEGSRTLFRVALAVFKLGENEIKAVSDPMEIFQVVQGLPRKMLGISALMGVACRRGGVAQAWVERKRAERKAWYAGQRNMEKVRKESRDAGRRESEARRESEIRKEECDTVAELQTVVDKKEPPPEPVLSPARSRSNSGWRGRIGLGFGARAASSAL